jgi:hypothetical protein
MDMRRGNGIGDRKGNGVASRAPWNDQVARLVSREGMARDKARDHVILESLKRGDSSALGALLIEGHVPAPTVRFVLALMLLDNEDAEAAIARQHVDPDLLWLPYRFVIKARPAQPRRPHAETPRVERGPARPSGPAMAELGYEAAIARLDQAVLATDAAAGKTAAAPKPTVRPQRPRPKPKR